MQAISAGNVKGIDVSKWQGFIDWPKVAASGVKFAFIKATQGTSLVDACLKRNAQEAHAAGIAVGYYHFATPEQSAVQQVDHFLNTIQGLPCDLPLVLDIEREEGLGKTYITTFCLTFLTELERRTNKLPMVYTGASFASTYLGKELSRYPLWVAHYGVDKPKPNKTWDRWAVFQFTDKGVVPGIKGNVDVNWMEADFFMRYMISKADCEKITKLLGILWTLEHNKQIDVKLSEGVDITKDEIHRLANEVRKAAGVPTT